jgi:hypothetical protein
MAWMQARIGGHFIAFSWLVNQRDRTADYSLFVSGFASLAASSSGNLLISVS